MTAADLQVTALKVDYREKVLGLGNPRPRLSWQIQSTARNVRQSAYRVLVAGSKEALRAGRGDFWDSGKVCSRKSLEIEYAGPPLISRQRCWWSVQVWNQADEPSAPSEPSWWEMGLLNASDWSAQWLAAEGLIASEDRKSGLAWIWGPEVPADRRTHAFRFVFDLIEPATRGQLIVTVRRQYWWNQVTRIWLDGIAIAGPGQWVGISGPIDPSSSATVSSLTCQDLALEGLKAGRHVLAVEIGTESIANWSFVLPDTPSVTPGLAALCRLELGSGKTLRLKSGPEWKTQSEALLEGWHETDYDDSSWSRAVVDPNDPYQPWPPRPAMHLRHTFGLEKKVASARLYATALGVYEARLNGAKVGDEVLSPGPSQYDRCLHYQVYDVGSRVQPGENVIGLTVADGWYAGFDGRFGFGPPPCRVIAQLELTFEDGTREVLTSGPGWRVAESAIRASQLKIGEVHDHRFEQPGWDRAGFDDSQWREAHLAERPSCQLMAQPLPPMRIERRIKPRAIVPVANGDYVIDLGLCFTGWCELQVKGAAGARIDFRYAEVLSSTGEVNPSNMLDPVGEPRRDVFFLKGDPAGERLAPRFVCRGFRYCQISGLRSSPSTDAIEGVMIHSDLQPTAAVRSDREIIPGILGLALQSQKSTCIGVQVDNTSRELRGHINSVGVFCPAAVYLMDVSTFLPHQVGVIVGEQTAEGNFPIYGPCPRYVELFPHPPGDEPGTALAVIAITWQCWRQYGDTQIIARNWQAMKRQLKFILDHNPNHLWLNKRHLDFGDWINPNATPKDLFASALWAHGVALLAQMAEAIGQTDEGRGLHELHARIREAFNKAYVSADGTIGNGSQGGFVLALAFDLLPQEVRTKAVDRLVGAIRERSPPSLATGIWSTRFILDVLADNGHADLACELLTGTDCPSWGYMLKEGATAIWEYWDGKVGTFNQPELGSVASFLMRRIAGIEAAAPGFEKITIRPLIDPRLDQGGGDYDSVMGRISTDWQRTCDGQFILNATIPANCTAQVHLPAGQVIEVGSGTYRFSVKP